MDPIMKPNDDSELRDLMCFQVASSMSKKQPSTSCSATHGKLASGFLSSALAPQVRHSKGSRMVDTILSTSWL